jgi:hypothetical protein
MLFPRNAWDIKILLQKRLYIMTIINGSYGNVISKLMESIENKDDASGLSSSFRSAVSSANFGQGGSSDNASWQKNSVESLNYPGANSAGGAPPIPDQGAPPRKGALDPAQVLADAVSNSPTVAPEFQSAVDSLRDKNLWAARAGMIAGTVKSLKETGKQLLSS